VYPSRQSGTHVCADAPEADSTAHAQIKVAITVARLRDPSFLDSVFSWLVMVSLLLHRLLKCGVSIPPFTIDYVEGWRLD
jgi:hypothetical protein